jgi:hypothetical protein
VTGDTATADLEQKYSSQGERTLALSVYTR